MLICDYEQFKRTTSFGLRNPISSNCSFVLSLVLAPPCWLDHFTNHENDKEYTVLGFNLLIVVVLRFNTALTHITALIDQLHFYSRCVTISLFCIYPADGTKGDGDIQSCTDWQCNLSMRDSFLTVSVFFFICFVSLV